LSGEKTEQPTPKRLREAREKGQVAKSQEVPAAALVLSLAVYLLAMGPSIMATLRAMAEATFNMAFAPFDQVFALAVSIVGRGMLEIVAPIVALVVTVSFLSSLAQVGLLFSVKAAAPKMENLSPAKWFKKTFSISNLIDLLKNIIKVVVLSVIVYKILGRHWHDLFRLPKTDATGLTTVLGSSSADLAVWAASAFACLAAADYAWQRHKYNKDHMMTKDEVKREYKEMEGDPIIKSRRRQLHQEMASQGAMDSVRKAKVLVTNPTRFAVALDYEKDRTPLPVILAKGEGELARRMIEAAKEAGIPILREAPLARELFEQGSENAYIPTSLIGPVAEVLRWLETLSNRPGGG
jgi:type III secretion protein U